MFVKKIVRKIRSKGLRGIIEKIPDYFRWKYILFLHKYVAKIPSAEAWQAQWFEYHKLEKKYINATYDLDSLFLKTTQITNEKNVWVYWNSGMDSAPEIVKKCFSQLKKNLPQDYKLVLLTQENIKDFVNFPDFVQDKLQKGIICQAHFSDMLRTALIYKYGGIWLDSTCLLTQKIPEKVLNSKFFVFQTNLMTLNETCSPIKCSNWFISSNVTGCKILGRTLQILLAFWQKNNRVWHYYLYHLVLSAVINNDEECYKIWNEMPYICNVNPHVLLYSFEKEYSQNRWYNIIESCFVHKLTYKYNPRLLEAPNENIFQHLMKLF